LNVENIRLINFRNYHSINVNFNQNINIFIGKNAQGKTNLLEAIYMCSNGKSFRTNRDKEIINFEKKVAYIGVNVKTDRFEKFIELKLDKENSKIIRINKNTIENYKELETGLSVVIFSPDDLKLVKEGPHERRNFMDLSISQIKPVYSYNISRYNRLLYQRNKILKSNKMKKELYNLLEAFDLQIAKIGTSIIYERNAYLNDFFYICKNTHHNLTSYKENMELRYNTNVPILDNKIEMEKVYFKLLKDNFNKDIEYGTTEIGPHRDDIFIFINSRDVRIFGSQGQQRTAVLTLKLSEVELIKKENGNYPIVLLDDVFSELDEERRNYLTNSFAKMQTFITVTDAVDIKSLDNFNKSIFYIENGRLEIRS